MSKVGEWLSSNWTDRSVKKSRKIGGVLPKSLKNFGFLIGGEKVEFLLFFESLILFFRYRDESNIFSERSRRLVL